MRVLPGSLKGQLMVLTLVATILSQLRACCSSLKISGRG